MFADGWRCRSYVVRCCSLFVVCWLLVVAVFAVCGWLFDACCLAFVVVAVCCLLCDFVRCLALCVGCCCLKFDVYGALFDVRWSLLVVGCLVLVACRALLSVV